MAADQAPSTSQKRKRGDDSDVASPSKKLAKSPRVKRDPNEEKRLRRYRPKAPQAFSEVYSRATSQRFFVLSRSRVGHGDEQEETVELAGSTGNIYTVVIARQPSCDCPHAKAGNQCKHVLYVMARVLRARYEYVYQLALLGSELREIFETAGPVPSEDGEGKEDRNRKPIEGECPICYEGMEKGEALVYCRASCGQNMHKTCLEMWAATKRAQGTVAKVTCPYCRTPWEGDQDMVKKIETTGKVGAEGYRNVADQLGISTERDTSSYSRWWTGHRSGGYYGGW
ncbi:SWIM zinc finger protein [Coniochaeta ligniaria NRRL 30616]|uniref:SWIM zinc finger protein n=1 Tax=Coniochaeta ligniaria NRRL 30616 TaxID=1408157 RepID=A0A1J7ITZ8_9PEZI|nr:SWIM zinc finger protein [Coniochaeta ligniaria NRRL 30616]